MTEKKSNVKEKSPAQKVQKPKSLYEKKNNSSEHNAPIQEHYQTIVQRATIAPQTITSSDLNTLQRTIGMQAVGQLMNQPQKQKPTLQRKQKRVNPSTSLNKMLANGKLTIQPKLTVGPVNDKYEQEADSVAKQVVQKINSPSPKTTASEGVQRQEDEEMQMKPISSIQRQEDEEMQMKGDEAMLQGGEVSQDIERKVQQTKGSGQPITDNTREEMNSAFGADFSDVKIHTGATADSLNRSISARAFTSGKNVFFRSGEYNPDSSSGKELLAHELTHTIQQGSIQSPIQRRLAMNKAVTLKQKISTGMPANLIQRKVWDELTSEEKDTFKDKYNSDKKALSRMSVFVTSQELYNFIVVKHKNIRPSDSPSWAQAYISEKDSESKDDKSVDNKDEASSRNISNNFNFLPGDVLVMMGGPATYVEWVSDRRGEKHGTEGRKSGHTAIALGSDSIAEANSSGVRKANLVGGTIHVRYKVYRSKNQVLAAKAAEIAKRWSPDSKNEDKGTNIGYSKSKLGKTMASRGFNPERALKLGAYAAMGQAPKNVFCSEYVVSCYQAAAYQDLIDEKAEKIIMAEANKKKYLGMGTTKGVRQGIKSSTTRLLDSGIIPSEQTGSLNFDPQATSPANIYTFLLNEAEKQTDVAEWEHIGQWEGGLSDAN